MLRPSASAAEQRARFMLLALAFFHFFGFAYGQVFSCVGGSVYLVAHPDDDLLFQSPDLLTDVQGQNCVTTVYLTSGDSGIGSVYAQSRESGNEAAYAQMMGVSDTWTEFNATFGGQTVLVRTLTGAPQVQKVWFRLPDGNVDGTGYGVTGYETLRELYFESIDSLTNQPGYATYTLATLKTAIAQILTARQPVHVRTLDYLSDYDAGDHSDHLTTARLTQELAGSYAPSASLQGYMGYPVANLAPTISTKSTNFTGKSNAFFTYTPYDVDECQSYTSCVNAGRGEASWIIRQYVVTPALATSSTIGSADDPVALPTTPNVAPLATITASTVASGSPAFAAIDGVISGYPGNSSAEWSSDHEGVGAKLTFTWSSIYNLTAVVLYDRPNTNDWMQGANLTFSDGTSISIGTLYNDGSATLITFAAPIYTKSIVLTVTAVASSTSNIGLSEFRAYGVACPTCATPSVTSSSKSASSTKASSTSSGKTSSTSKASSTSSSKPSSSSSSIKSSSSQSSSATVATALPSSTAAFSTINLAFDATVSASSYDSVDDSPAIRAADGLFGGYTDDNTGDQTMEWSSDHELVGAALTYKWNQSVTIGKIIIADRPNMEDFITGGTLTFSDGSKVKVPTLINDGTPSTFYFTPVKTTSLVFTVISVASTSSNVGLSELQVFGVAGAAYSSGLASVNLARYATATSSSQSYQQGPGKAIDGLIGGYTSSGGDPYQEWASDSEGVGATYTLTWKSAVSLAQVVLYDRPNTGDWMTGATLTFSDGSALNIPSLNNDGSATAFNFASKNTTSLVLKVTSVGSSSSSVGLSEFQAYAVAGTVTGGTTLSFGSGSSSSSSKASSASSTGASSTKSSSASATATSGSAQPSSTATFSTINLAFDATVSASTYDSVDDSPAIRAADGLFGGYTDDNTGDQTMEWSSDHELVGATLTYKWSQTVTIGKVIVADRPNLEDQVTGATLTFSDGSKVTLGSLPNDGTPSTFYFTPVKTTSLVFTVTSVSSSTSNVGLSELQVFGVSGAAYSAGISAVNLARYATATSSSQAYQQGPGKAIDGLIGGYTTSGGDSYQEWATNSEGAGATYTLTWSSAVSLAQVVLFDRPNTGDWMTGSTLTFSDGSVLTLSSLKNDGSATAFSFPTKSTTSLILKVTSVGPSSSSVGLSEFQAFGTAGTVSGGTTLSFGGSSSSSASSVKSSSASSTASSSSAKASSSSSAPSSAVPTGSVSSSSSSSKASSALPSSTQASSTGSSSSVSSTKTSSSVSASSSSSSSNASSSSMSSNSSKASSMITISKSSTATSTSPSPSASSTQSYSSINLAFTATVSASSQDVGDDSLANRAVDGIYGGYVTDFSGDSTTEWSSDHQTAGATLTLTWPSAVSVAKVVLSDRPNSNDQATGGTISFSDGSMVSVGSLPNDGTPLTVTFTSRTVTSLTFTVTSASSTTASVGLSEIAVYGLSSSPSPSSFNLARYATSSASSSSTNQESSKAINGIIGGYTSNAATNSAWVEWASNGGGVGTTFTLNWSSTVIITSITLYDRPNLSDQITAGTITFGGSSTTLTVGTLANDGSATSVPMSGSISTNSLTLKVTGVSGTTGSVGLAEIEVFGSFA